MLGFAIPVHVISESDIGACDTSVIMRLKCPSAHITPIIIVFQFSWVSSWSRVTRAGTADLARSYLHRIFPNRNYSHQLSADVAPRHTLYIPSHWVWSKTIQITLDIVWPLSLFHTPPLHRTFNIGVVGTQEISRQHNLAITRLQNPCAVM